MDRSDATFTLAYIVFAICVVFTPNEFRSAGLTVQNIFSEWLGSEDTGFIQNHIKRTTLTILIHSSLPIEFRRIDKFATGPPDVRVIITDTWVMKVTVYNLHVTLQQDAHLTVIDSRQHDLSPDSNTPIQILTLTVASINPKIKSFDIRLNSTEYTELREKLHSPIRNAADVVVHLTLSDLFLETFKCQVEMNQVYRYTSGQELELCIGCMQVRANIKLMQLCQDIGDGECYCRPMWCLVCMGKWFASRQDQTLPETWLSSTVPCPTSRARFCILDVCRVE